MEKKIVIIGDGYVGKTSILHAMRNRNFQEQLPNVYDEFEFQQTVNMKQFTIKFVDTAGQEEYDTLRKFAYLGANLFLLCFAVTDKVSYENLSTKWLKDLEINRNTPVVLVGTKLDLRTNGADYITKEQAVRFQKKIGAVYYIECSSKTGDGIIELKETAIRALFRNENKKSCLIQ